MPSCSSCVDIGGYTAWSLPSTAWPSSRARAATPPMKVPAMPRMWTFIASLLAALADFLDRRDRLDDAGEHVVERTHAVDHGQLAVLAVVLDHRRGLRVVHFQA